MMRERLRFYNAALGLRHRAEGEAEADLTLAAISSWRFQ